MVRVSRIVSILLAVLLTFPIGLLCLQVSAAETISIPAEPKLTNTTTKHYIGNGGKGTVASNSPANYLPTSGWDPVNYPQASNSYPMSEAMANGGTFVVVAKGYVGASPAVIAATSSPVLFTAADVGTDYTGTIDSESDSNNDGIYDGQGTQTGMFMIKSQGTVTFMGDVIFDKITIIDRTNGAKAAAGTPQTTTIDVGATGKLVIGKDTVITGSHNDKENSLYNPILSVQEGGYAYLHAVGFSQYTGKGTIVLDKDLVDGAKIKAEDFASFDGVVAYASGEILVDNRGKDTTPENPGADTQAPDTEKQTDKVTDAATKKPATTDKVTDKQTQAETGTTAVSSQPQTQAQKEDGNVVIWIIVGVAAVAAAAVIVIVVVKKKK